MQFSSSKKTDSSFWLRSRGAARSKSLLLAIYVWAESLPLCKLAWGRAGGDGTQRLMHVLTYILDVRPLISHLKKYKSTAWSVIM